MPEWWEYPVSQGFGPTNEPLDSAYGGYRHFNKGLDFGTPAGTNVRAIVGGKVVAAGPGNEGWGTRVWVQDAQGNTHNYGHLSKASVKVGQVVNPGDSLGLSGSTGKSTGPHVSYDVWDGQGRFINPTQFLGGGGSPPAPMNPGGPGLQDPAAVQEEYERAIEAYNEAIAKRQELEALAEEAYNAILNTETKPGTYPYRAKDKDDNYTSDLNLAGKQLYDRIPNVTNLSAADKAETDAQRKLEQAEAKWKRIPAGTLYGSEGGAEPSSADERTLQDLVKRGVITQDQADQISVSGLLKGAGLGPKEPVDPLDTRLKTAQVEEIEARIANLPLQNKLDILAAEISAGNLKESVGNAIWKRELDRSANEKWLREQEMAAPQRAIDTITAGGGGFVPEQPFNFRYSGQSTQPQPFGPVVRAFMPSINNLPDDPDIQGMVQSQMPHMLDLLKQIRASQGGG